MTPRTLTASEPRSDISLKLADKLGLAVTGRGRFLPEDADIFGRMSAEAAIGKTSDSVIHFRDGFPEEWSAHGEGQGLELGGALLEARIIYRRLPLPGDG